MATLKIQFWNVKAPSLTRRGAHNWKSRRTGLRKKIGSVDADVVALTETGSGLDLLWWKTNLKKYGFRWAKGGKAWQNNFLGEGVKFVAGGSMNQPANARLHGDDKPMVWTIFEFLGKEWIIGNVHPENENGFDHGVPSEQIRKRQVRNTIRYIDTKAQRYGIPPERRIVVTDNNSPTGGVTEWVHENTDYRDAFTLTDNTTNRFHVSNNKWQRPRNGKRIDVVYVWKGADVVGATNSENHELSDHNTQVVSLLV